MASVSISTTKDVVSSLDGFRLLQSSPQQMTGKCDGSSSPVVVDSSKPIQQLMRQKFIISGGKIFVQRENVIQEISGGGVSNVSDTDKQMTIRYFSGKQMGTRETGSTRSSSNSSEPGGPYVKICGECANCPKINCQGFDKHTCKCHKTFKHKKDNHIRITTNTSTTSTTTERSGTVATTSETATKTALINEDLTPEIEENLMQLQKFNIEQNKTDYIRDTISTGGIEKFVTVKPSGNSSKRRRDSEPNQDWKPSEENDTGVLSITCARPKKFQPEPCSTESSQSKKKSPVAKAKAVDTQHMNALSLKNRLLLSRHKNWLKKDILTKKKHLEMALQFQIDIAVKKVIAVPPGQNMATVESFKSILGGQGKQKLSLQSGAPTEQLGQLQSLYLSEKQDIKKIKKKQQRKDKGKPRFTGYMLWARDVRPKITQSDSTMDFSAVNKKLGNLWSLVPPIKKYNWKRRAKRMSQRLMKKIDDLEEDSTYFQPNDMMGFMISTKNSETNQDNLMVESNQKRSMISTGMSATILCEEEIDDPLEVGIETQELNSVIHPYVSAIRESAVIIPSDAFASSTFRIKQEKSNFKEEPVDIVKNKIDDPLWVSVETQELNSVVLPCVLATTESAVNIPSPIFSSPALRVKQEKSNLKEEQIDIVEEEIDDPLRVSVETQKLNSVILPYVPATTESAVSIPSTIFTSSSLSVKQEKSNFKDEPIDNSGQCFRKCVGQLYMHF